MALACFKGSFVSFVSFVPLCFGPRLRVLCASVVKSRSLDLSDRGGRLTCKRGYHRFACRLKQFQKITGFRRQRLHHHSTPLQSSYSGTYDRFGELRAWLDSFENLYLIGRNGMHRYNNQDHSMLAAMVAVDNLVAGRSDKANIWAVNTELAYHETK